MVVKAKGPSGQAKIGSDDPKQALGLVHYLRTIGYEAWIEDTLHGFLLCLQAKPTAALPLLIFDYAKQPYEQARQYAWTSALVLITIIMLTVIIFRWIANRSTIKGAS